jgi:hypothetical protein
MYVWYPTLQHGQNAAHRRARAASNLIGDIPHRF